MKKACKDFRSNKLKLMVKKLIKESEEKKIIKPHVFAYKDTPVSLEEHKGNVMQYVKKTNNSNKKS